MKTTTFKRAIFAIAMMLITAFTSWAYDFIVDGIYYNYNGDGETVSVTYKNKDYNSYSGSVVIPSTVTYGGTTYSVAKIGESAFERCRQLTSVNIPESVTEIGLYSFYSCESMTSVNIPSSVTTICKNAFESCWKLTKVEISNIADWCNISFASIPSNPLYFAKHLYLNGTEVTDLVIPESVTEIHPYAFCFCHGFKSVTINDSVTSIGEAAFQNCIEMTSLTISNSITSISRYTFYNCEKLTSAIIPESVTEIGESAFQNCLGMTSLTIGESVTSINQYAFSGCYTLSSVNIPESVTEIGDGAFETCSNLTSLTIGNSVTSIGSYAFNNCKNLISVTIPKSVNKIGDKAFYNCYGIMSFTSLNTTPPSAPSENVFKGIPRSDCTLFVPEESITSYSGSTGWSYFYNIQGIKNDHVETVEHNVVKVATADGAISISGADGAIAEIFSTSGTLLYRGSDATIKMPHGIYIVKVAEKTTKVVL